jgi:hypothetical protein
MSSGEFIPYLRAQAKLKARLNATADEIAMWVWLGPKDGGLAAYFNPYEPDFRKRKPREPELPRQFFFQSLALPPKNWNYHRPMQDLYFRTDELERFKPADRFVTGAALVKHWGDLLGDELEAKDLIRSRIRQSRLIDLHPLSGGTQAGSEDDTDLPPLESALFPQRLIDAIECDELSENAELFTPNHRTRSVSSNQIIGAFLVKPDPANNVSWWDLRLTNAGRFKLLEFKCRASTGRGKTPSRWYPDLVADWLVSKGHMSARDAAAVLKAHFPDCADAAERLLSDDL